MTHSSPHLGEPTPGPVSRHKAPSRHLKQLIDANAPLWAGEAEVFRTYWDWPRRTRKTDLLWLARQCHKELFDGFLPRLRQLQGDFEQIEAGITRELLLEQAEGVYQELAHYCGFAAAYDALRQQEPPLDLATIRACNWQENLQLASTRARHRTQHGELGARAQAFTEGGYCTLYAEGMRLRGRGGADDLIAEACARVYDDEWDHMIHGIAGLEEHRLSAGDWALLTELSVEQMRLRIRMRNAQFGYPLSATRIQELQAGEIEPLPFDYGRAGAT